jgi:hypothetical protein
MTATAISRMTRGVAAASLAAVLALPVVPFEPPEASLLAWSGLAAVVAGVVARQRGAVDAGVLLLLVHYAAVLAFTSEADPLVWARAGVMVALMDLAHGSLEAAEPGDPGRWRWARTMSTVAMAAAAAAVVVLAAATAPGGLVVRIVAFGALSACLALLVLLIRRRGEQPQRLHVEPPVPSDR